MLSNKFPGLRHSADKLSAYINCGNVFMLSLLSKDVIRFQAPDEDAFIDWLKAHNIRDVRDEIGTLVYNHYFGKDKERAALPPPDKRLQ